MYRQQTLNGLAGLLMAAAAIPAFAQEKNAVRERTTVKTDSTSTTKVLKLSAVLKSNVVIQQDQSAGRVVDVVLSDNGCIDYYVASYEDEYYVIPYSAIVWRNNAVFVDITPAQFKSVQFFASNNWPDLTVATYRTKVFTTFGVTAPRRETQSTFKRETTDRDAPDRDARDPKNPRDAKNPQDRRDEKTEKRDPKDSPTPRDRVPEKPATKEPLAPRDRPQPGVIDPPKPAPERTPAEKPKSDEKSPTEKPKTPEKPEKSPK